MNLYLFSWLCLAFERKAVKVQKNSEEQEMDAGRL